MLASNGKIWYAPLTEDSAAGRVHLLSIYMASEIEQAIRQICEEKGLSYEAVIETIEAALGAAYRKDYGNKMQNIEAEFSPETGGVRVFDVKEVVEDLPEEQIEEMRRLQAEELAGEQAEKAAEKIGFRDMEKAPKKEE
ncbi:MAG: hypothetical protein KDD60_12760, partial [Bdellovibrionales bacterium]|nr:hypothetical protein [Bdellovibrionales bacterium]